MTGGARRVAKVRKQRTEVLIGVFAALVATALIAGGAVLWNAFTGEKQNRTDLAGLFVGSGALAVLLAVAGFRRARHLALRMFEPGIRRKLTPTIREEVRQEYESLVGLTQVYANFNECRGDLELALRASSTAAIFLQLGRTVIAGKSTFYDALKEMPLREEAQIRILHAGPNSPYLTRRAARERGSNYNKWLNDLDYAEKTLADLSRTRQQSILARQHVEGYVWQLYIFDREAFVQPYLAHKKNSENAPVLRFARFAAGGDDENRSSLYHAFSRYFDLKWDERRPDSTTLDRFITEPDAAVVAGCLTNSEGLHVFVIPRRYVETAGRDIRFHCAGGKPQTGETLLEALHREVREEINAEVSIEASTQTRFVTSFAEQAPMYIEGSPAPSIIYNRIRENDPNLPDSEQWIVAWNATILLGDDGLERPLKPRGEIGAVLYLTPEMLKEISARSVTYREIQRATDGSKLSVEQHFSFPFEKNAVPTGMASIIASAPPTST